VLPFWALALAGLAVSTWAVRAMELLTMRITDAKAIQTMMVMAASLAAFGSLWIVKFFVLDRFLFGGSPESEKFASSG
jgi:hypothetical protein